MSTTPKSLVTALASAVAATLFVPSATAADPVVVWDGDKAGYDFSALTRIVDDNTYTLNLNEMNSVAADGSYVQIGSTDAKAAITITAVNDDTSVTNAFGTDGAVTVIMKYTDLPVSAGSNRALISLLDSQKYKQQAIGDDNSVKIGVSSWSGSGYFIWQGGSYASLSGVHFSATEQTAALSYSSTDGTMFYLDGIASTNTGLKSGSYTTPCGIALGGVDTDGSTQYFAMTGMKIKAVAVFTSTLTAEQIANYKFPSKAPISVSLVSEINDIFGLEDEIDVIIADGATITGDTTFNASTVRFHCEGSFEFIPPAGNTAVLDFSGVTGQPVIIYDGVLPEKSGNTFTANSIPTFVTDSTQWTGTIWLKNIGVTDFTVNPYGNESSVVRLTTIWGWISAPGNYAFTNSVPVELCDEGSSPALNLTNGNSANTPNPNRCTVFKKLSGNGTLSGNSSADKVVVVVQDASDFTGGISLDSGKIVVFGETMPAQTSLTAGSIVVMKGASVTAQPASGTWKATGGIKVDGELRASGLNKFDSSTTITTGDDGVFTLIDSNDTQDQSVNYARITGTGTLRYADVPGKWRTLSMVNFPTNMVCENNLSAGLILQRSGAVHTIGSLAGSGQIRSDWGGSENIGDRDLRILQAKDTTYSGEFASINDRVRDVYVAPGVSSAGTLTLSGMQTASNDLTVESGAAVNLTGTWVGATTVAGTIGGTGTLTGDLTLSNGATIKVADMSDTLAVSGDLTVSGTVTVDLPAGTVKGLVVSVSGTTTVAPGTKFNVLIGGEPSSLIVKAVADGLKAAPAPFQILIR